MVSLIENCASGQVCVLEMFCQQIFFQLGSEPYHESFYFVAGQMWWLATTILHFVISLELSVRELAIEVSSTRENLQ